MKFEIDVTYPFFPAGVIKQAIENAMEHEFTEKGYAQEVSVRQVQEKS